MNAGLRVRRNNGVPRTHLELTHNAPGHLWMRMCARPGLSSLLSALILVRSDAGRVSMQHTVGQLVCVRLLHALRLCMCKRKCPRFPPTPHLAPQSGTNQPRIKQCAAEGATEWE